MLKFSTSSTEPTLLQPRPAPLPNANDRHELVNRLADQIAFALGNHDLAFICADYLVPEELVMTIHGLHGRLWHSQSGGRLVRTVHHCNTLEFLRPFINDRYIVKKGWVLEVSMNLFGPDVTDSSTIGAIMRGYQMDPQLVYFDLTVITEEVQERRKRRKLNK
jgi:hypothetical protein